MLCQILRLNQDRSIVTGAGSGIGLSIVRLLLKNTTVALVVAVDIKISALQELELEYSPKLKILEGDISKRRANEEAVQAAIGQTGRLDAIILNAGILGPISPAVDGDVNEWTKLFEINFFGPLHGVGLMSHFRFLYQLSVDLKLTTPSGSSGVSTPSQIGWTHHIHFLWGVFTLDQIVGCLLKCQSRAKPSLRQPRT